jgi:hypothetical protein
MGGTFIRDPYSLNSNTNTDKHTAHKHTDTDTKTHMYIPYKHKTEDVISCSRTIAVAEFKVSNKVCVFLLDGVTAERAGQPGRAAITLLFFVFCLCITDVTDAAHLVRQGQRRGHRKNTLFC